MTKISKKLRSKLRALSAAQSVIEENALTPVERMATVRVLEENWNVAASEHLPTLDEYLELLREGLRGWDDSSDAQLASELMDLFGDIVFNEEQS